MKKAIAFILCLAMIAGSVVTSFAADKAIGTTLRLSKTEGTVTVKNASGKTQTTKADMKLYSGYTVKTAKRSYAYISLDDSKAIKLDASTEVEITKSGKKLEVFIKSGQIFFDVTEKLKSDESMNIRTSTMVTGIHGTMGVADEDNMLLLEGETRSKEIKKGTKSDPERQAQEAKIDAMLAAQKIKEVSNLPKTDVMQHVTDEIKKIDTENSPLMKRVLDRVDKKLLSVEIQGQQGESDGEFTIITSPENSSEDNKREITGDDIPGFALKEIAENQERLNRIKKANNNSNLSQELADMTKQEAQAIQAADEVLNDLFVPIDSPAFPDGTPNNLKPASTTNTAVDMTKPLDVLQEDGTNTMDEGSGEDVITPPTPPVIEDDYYEPPAPPATPTDLTVTFYDTDGTTLLGSVTVPSGGNVAASGSEFLSNHLNDTWTKNGQDYTLSAAVTESFSLVKKGPTTFKVTLPQDIIFSNTDVAQAGSLQTIAAFRVAPGVDLNTVPAGEKVVFAVDYNITSAVNEYSADSYSITPFVNGSSLGLATSQPTEDPPDGFRTTYYETPSITADTDVTIEFRLNNSGAKLATIPTALSDTHVTKVYIVEGYGLGDMLPNLTVGQGQTLVIDGQVSFNGFTNNGGIIVSTEMRNYGDIINNGIITFSGVNFTNGDDSGGTIANTSSGQIIFVTNGPEDKPLIDNIGEITNDNIISLAPGYTLRNYGTIIDNKNLVLVDENQFPFDLDGFGEYEGPLTVEFNVEGFEPFTATVRNGGTVAKYAEELLRDWPNYDWYIKDSNPNTRYDLTAQLYNDITLEGVGQP